MCPGYYRLTEERTPIFRLEGWIRRHIRKCFWQRWHAAGRKRKLRSLGLNGTMLEIAYSSKGAWPIARTVVWEGGRAQSRPPDLILGFDQAKL